MYGASTCSHTPQGPAQRAQRRPGVAFGQFDRASGVRGDRAKQPGVEARSNFLQLQAAGARKADVARLQHDLDIGGQQPCQPQRVGGRTDRPPDGAHRDLDASLRHPQQRQSGLRILAPAAGAPVGVLGRRESP